MNCDDFRAAFLAGDDTVESHFVECGACRSVRGDLEATRDALADAAVWEEPPRDLGRQVVSLISSTTQPAHAPRRTRRWLMPLVAAVAAVIVTVGLVGVLHSDPPDWEVTMDGTGLAPDARSSVAGWNTSAGTRMVIQIIGLEPAPDGHIYEFWLSNGSTHVSAGTFTEGGEVELGAGVSRADFPRLWVTLEPLDGDESPSGFTVLDTGT